MAGVLRGDICWANLNPVRGHEQGGTRPVLIISQDLFNERSGTVIALAITSQRQRAGYPLTWKLPAGALPMESWIKTTQIRTLSTERLSEPVGRLDQSDLQQIVAGLLTVIA